MFEKFTSAHQADFRQRYQGTFGFFVNNEEKKAPMLCKLQFIEDKITFLNAKGVSFEIVADTPRDIGFLFLPPKSGFFNTKFDAVYVERTAARQFQRGISDRNTRIFVLGETGFAAGAVTFKYLEAVFNEVLKPEKAWKRFLEKHAASYAISSQFAMNRTRVWVFGVPIGNVVDITDEKVVIKLAEALFKTELSDGFRNIGVKVEFTE